MPASSFAQWTWYIREAVERCMDEFVSGPWDDVIDIIAKTIDKGSITIEEAARLNRALAETMGTAPANCDVCECPAAGLKIHP